MIFGRKWPDLAVSLSDLRGLKGGSQNFFIKTKSLYLGLIFHNINSPFSNSTSLRQGIDFKTTRFPIFFTFSGQNRQSHPSLVEGKTITTIRIFFDKWSNIMNKLGGCDLAISGYTNFGPPPPPPPPTPIIFANISCRAYYWSDKRSHKILIIAVV